MDDSSLLYEICNKKNCKKTRKLEAKLSHSSMATSTSRLTFRIIMVVLFLLLIFYVGRPLYWKISATIHDIRENKQTVKQGTFFVQNFILFFIFSKFLSLYLVMNLSDLRGFRLVSGLSQIVLEAQKSVGWYHDEADSGVRDDRVGKKAVSRRLMMLHQVL